MALQSLLGDTLVKNDGTEVKTSELSTNEGGVIGIYFSAHWCPPCRGFTPKFAEVYKQLKAESKDFEVVFVSWDRSPSSFAEYHSEMPWLALPFDNDQKDELASKYEVEGIPTLAFVQANTGETITTEGTSIIGEFGAAAFPFTEECIKNAKQEVMNKKNQLLNKIQTDILSFIESSQVHDESTEFKDKLSTCDVIAFAFLRGKSCRGSQVVLPAILNAQQKLSNDKFGIIIVPLQSGDDDDFSVEAKMKLKSVPIITKGEKSSEVIKKFETVFDKIDAPHVAVLSITKHESSSDIELIAEDAAREIYMFGHEAFPWSDEAIKAYEAEKERQKAEKKKKLANFEIFEPTESCQILDKNNEVVPTESLRKNGVVGLYFSAHWCGPCRGFTPRLVDFYKECKEAGKTFEVVFVSSDRNQEEFDGYFGEMPWLTLRLFPFSLKIIIQHLLESEKFTFISFMNII